MEGELKDEKKRRSKINTPVVKVKLSNLQCVPLLHTFSDNAKEYLMTSALLTHISTYVFGMHPVTVWHFWLISVTQHIILMNK